MKRSYLLLLLLCAANLVCAQRTVLWSVKRANSAKTSYILGTFHQMGNSFIDERPVIRQRLGESDLALFESIEDRKEKIVNVMLQRADDFSYKNALNKEDLDFLEQFTASWEVPLSKQKPAELLVKLQQEYTKTNCNTVQPTDTASHMDDYLQALAIRQHIKIRGLENYADQFQAINSIGGTAFGWDKAKDAVHQWVLSFQDTKNRKKICALAKAYMDMKLDYQFKAKCAEDDGLLLARNEKWMPTIRNILQENNSVFIAVGLFHLYGTCGLIAQLRNEGYEVNPVPLK